MKLYTENKRYMEKNEIEIQLRIESRLVLHAKLFVKLLALLVLKQIEPYNDTQLDLLGHYRYILCDLNGILL